MNRRTLSFLALAVSMLYGVTVGVLHPGQAFTSFGGVVVALLWIATGMLGRPEAPARERNRAR